MPRDGDGVHIRKGYWQFRYRVPEGNYRYQNTHVKASKKKVRKPPTEAITFRGRLLEELRFGLPTSMERWRIAKASDDWLKALENRDKVSRSTRLCYRDWLTQVRRLLGNRRLDEVTVALWEWYQATRKAQQISNRTINRELQLVSVLLKRAKLWRRLEEDFQARQDSPWLPVSKESPRKALTPTEFRQLVATALRHSDWLVTLCAELLAWATGCRSKEIKTLQLKAIHMHQEQCWADCPSWVGPHICIVRRIQETNETATKTEAGKRRLPLNAVARWAMQQLLERARLLNAIEPGHYLLPRNLARHTKPSDPLYPRRFEGFDPSLHQESWQTSWASLRREAGLSWVHFHDLRHSFKTVLRRVGGADTKLAMLLMGHLSPEMVRYYEHPEEQEAREAVDKIADANPLLLEMLGISARTETIN